MCDDDRGGSKRRFTFVIIILTKVQGAKHSIRWVGYPHSHQWWSLRSLSAIKNISTVISRYYWVSLLKYLWGANWELGLEPSVLIDSAEIIRLSTNKHPLYILQPELCLSMPTNNFTTLYLQLTKLKSTCNSITNCLDRCLYTPPTPTTQHYFFPSSLAEWHHYKWQIWHDKKQDGQN